MRPSTQASRLMVVHGARDTFRLRHDDGIGERTEAKARV
jgi:hypothetical protein